MEKERPNALEMAKENHESKKEKREK